MSMKSLLLSSNPTAVVLENTCGKEQGRCAATCPTPVPRATRRKNGEQMAWKKQRRRMLTTDHSLKLRNQLRQQLKHPTTAPSRRSNEDKQNKTSVSSRSAEAGADASHSKPSTSRPQRSTAPGFARTTQQSAGYSTHEGYRGIPRQSPSVAHFKKTTFRFVVKQL